MPKEDVVARTRLAINVAELSSLRSMPVSRRRDPVRQLSLKGQPTGVLLRLLRQAALAANPRGTIQPKTTSTETEPDNTRVNGTSHVVEALTVYGLRSEVDAAMMHFVRSRW